MLASVVKPSTFSGFCSTKYQSSNKVCLQSLNFSRELTCRRSVSRVPGRINQVSMKIFSGIPRAVDDEGTTSAFEQEPMVGGRSLDVGRGWLEATLNNLSKWFISGIFAVIILVRHDPEALWASIGAILNAVASIQLKKIINQDRPIPTSRPDPGMPSSHAQAIFFVVAFVNLSLIEWLGMSALTTTLSGFSFVTGCYFSWLRVSQRHHTVSQVIVGAVAGSIFAGLWFWSWHAFVFNYFTSSMWAKAVIILSALGFCSAFVVHVWNKWLLDER